MPATGPDASRDLAERRQVQARMERLACALDLSGDALFVVDRTSMACLEVNDAACTLTGVMRQALVGQPASKTSLPLGELEALGKLYDEVIAQAPVTHVSELTVHRANREERFCEARHVAIQQDGQWVIVAALRDVTDQRKAMSRCSEADEELRSRTAELTRVRRELEEFAYIASHDLSEPLRAVASYAQLLERRYAPQLDEDARDFIGYIVGGARRMKAMMDDLLVYSRAGRRELAMRPVPLDRALDDALAYLAPVIRRSQATVEREPLPTIEGDTVAMTQVFQHLIGNALAFHEEGQVPQVRVSARDEGAEWTIEVRDQGIGIDPQHFQRIFLVFQRLRSRDDSQGTGIGLAVCKKLVERHGGRITVGSAPGRGAAFAVHLPKTR